MQLQRDPELQWPMRRHLLLGAAGMCAWPAFAVAAEARSVEFAELMHRLMRARAAVTPPAWAELNAWPVRWRTPGPARLPRPQPGRAVLRIGDMVLLTGGKPAYRRSNRQPGVWTLGAYGSEQAVEEVTLGMAQLAVDISLSLAALEAHGFSVQPVCQPQGAQGDSVFLVAHAEHAPMRVVETYSGGSGGNSVDLRLPYTPAAIRTAVCN
jgi:hypothetical protein